MSVVCVFRREGGKKGVSVVLEKLFFFLKKNKNPIIACHNLHMITCNKPVAAI